MSTKPARHASLADILLGAAVWTRGLLADRFEICRTATVPAIGRQMQKEHRAQFVGNFESAAGVAEGPHRGPRWDDGDFYKWIEAAAAVNAIARDAALDAELDRLIGLVTKAQEPDGYIHTDVQIKLRQGKEAKRFDDPMDFEMYNMGHLMSAACVHHRATGKGTLLDVAIKAAKFLDAQFAEPTPQIARNGICPAHLMGLVDLYKETGDRRHLDLACRLLAMRDLVQDGDDDNQDRVPFGRQRQAVGHAVRATYLYAGAAGIYAETGDGSLLESLEAIWADLVSHKLQITGGCGSLYDGASPDGSSDQRAIKRVHQAFGRDYQLPQATAHNESCAAVGNLLWNWRMLKITGEARFADVIEQTLYNSVLAAVSLDGTRFFYTNTLRQLDPMPVELRWPRQRQAYLDCFCCPPNVARTVAQSSGFAYAKSDRDVWVVLYGGSALDTEVAGARLKIRQETDYPWDGQIRITIEAAPSEALALHLRIPQWAAEPSLRVNGKEAAAEPKPGTFCRVDRKWAAGDTIELAFPMPVRLVEANPLVEETRNHLAVMRGPIVYCLESPDLPVGVGIQAVYLNDDADFAPICIDALRGVVALEGRVVAIDAGDWRGRLYRDKQSSTPRTIDIRLIPYFAWDNRGKSEMTVWLPKAK